MAIFLNPYELKPWFTRRLALFIHWAVRKNVSPDVFTLVGVFGALVGGLFLALIGLGVSLPWWLTMAAVFFFGLVVRLAGANLDGAVARARGVSRPAGFILNELGDRLSDFALFFGLLIASPAQWKFVVVLITMLSVLPTLVSVSGAAVGSPRFNGGPFGKTERSIAFVIAAGLLAQGVDSPWGTFFFALLMFVMGFGAVQTAIVRWRRIVKHVAENGTLWRDDQPTVVKAKNTEATANDNNS